MNELDETNIGAKLPILIQLQLIEYARIKNYYVTNLGKGLYTKQEHCVF